MNAHKNVPFYQLQLWRPEHFARARQTISVLSPECECSGCGQSPADSGATGPERLMLFVIEQPKHPHTYCPTCLPKAMAFLMQHGRCPAVCVCETCERWRAEEQEREWESPFPPPRNLFQEELPL